MEFCKWPEYVNRKILDSTTFTIGEGGRLEDKNDSGGNKDSRLTSVMVPTTFNVVMDFDWLIKDKEKYGSFYGISTESSIYEEQGYSEFDRFVNWYEYEHKRGTKPFLFPSITNFGINKPLSMSYYKITSPLKPIKSGFSMRVSMTWEEVYNGIINIKPKTDIPERIYGNPFVVHVVYLTERKMKPDVSKYNFYVQELNEDGSEKSADYATVLETDIDGNEELFKLRSFENIRSTYKITMDKDIYNNRYTCLMGGM